MIRQIIVSVIVLSFAMWHRCAASPQDWAAADRALHDACALEYAFNCPHNGQEPQSITQMTACLVAHERLATFSKPCQAAIAAHGK